MRTPYGTCGRCGKPVYRGRKNGGILHPAPYHNRCFDRTKQDDNTRAYVAALSGAKENLS